MCIRDRQKTVFVGINTLHLGVYDAVNTFNKGNIARSQVFKKLEMSVGKSFCETMKRFDFI